MIDGSRLQIIYLKWNKSERFLLANILVYEREKNKSL